MPKKLTKEEFVESVKKIHGDSIDLSEAEYVKDCEKVKCRCNTCNTIWFATPNNLKKGRGCPRCSHRSTKYTLEEWKSMVSAKYGDKYDLSEVREYNGREQPMKVICHNKFDNGIEHGVFYMSAKSILDGRNCPHCSRELSIKANESKKITPDEWEKKASAVHGKKYTYCGDYINARTKVKITCPIHGDFYQSPRKHLNGHGCPKCGGSLKLKQEEFIEKVKKVHGDKYDLTNTKYVNSATKVSISCKKHGEFTINPQNLLRGNGCQICGEESRTNALKYNIAEVLEMCKNIHGDKYDYSKSEYKNMLTPFKIICPYHGEFEQTPSKHIHSKQGCPKCNSSHLEIELSKFLDENGIDYKQFYRSRWLGLQNLDFYLPKYNIGIECQGIQHYEPISFCGDKSDDIKNKNFEVIRARDEHKKVKCLNNNVKLLYFTHCENVNEDETTFKDKNKLLNEIVKNGLIQ